MQSPQGEPNTALRRSRYRERVGEKAQANKYAVRECRRGLCSKGSGPNGARHDGALEDAQGGSGVVGRGPDGECAKGRDGPLQVWRQGVGGERR